MLGGRGQVGVWGGVGSTQSGLVEVCRDRQPWHVGDCVEAGLLWGSRCIWLWVSIVLEFCFPFVIFTTYLYLL